MQLPKQVKVSDITIRDGFQHEEHFIPTASKIWLGKQLIKCGFKDLEVTNYGNPIGMPQFKDADDVLKGIRRTKSGWNNALNTQLTAVTIREKAIERAIEAKKEGYGPDRILLMVSTSEAHHLVNSGISLNDYWNMAERYIQMAKDVGMKVCGTVSTIWGCPLSGSTDMRLAVDFTKRWLSIGADDIEHADHDGSGTPKSIYEYFSMLMEQMNDPIKHIVHLHSTRGWGLANVLAALQAGMNHFESTFGGIGGQPANFVDGVPVAGTGKYYIKDPNISGLISTEDLVVMLDEMGISTGLNVDKVLETGEMVERIVGRRLRSESIKSGRIIMK
jgi:hydroxymethylglutaryl-CoA lyase